MIRFKEYIMSPLWCRIYDMAEILFIFLFGRVEFLTEVFVCDWSLEVDSFKN